jgi:hypothetical protein
VSDDPVSADAVARSMGLGGDLPPAPERPGAAAAASLTGTGLEVPRSLPWWRRGGARAVIVTAALVFSGYVFSWGDVEQESRVVAAIAGGFVFALFTLALGVAWWILRALAGRRRPFGRTVFNYGLVGVIFVLGILGADEFLG